MVVLVKLAFFFENYRHLVEYRQLVVMWNVIIIHVATWQLPARSHHEAHAAWLLLSDSGGPVAGLVVLLMSLILQGRATPRSHYWMARPINAGKKASH